MLGGLLLIILAILVFACVCRGSDRAAYTLLQVAGHMFEPSPGKSIDASPVKPTSQHIPTTRVTIASPPKSGNKRPYISPSTKKIVASRPKWRCAVCGRLLDASYEIDHIRQLFSGRSGGGTNDIANLNDISNLQALCRSPCHIQKSAMERKV